MKTMYLSNDKRMLLDASATGLIDVQMGCNGRKKWAQIRLIISGYGCVYFHEPFPQSMTLKALRAWPVEQGFAPGQIHYAF